MKSQRSD